jgi:crotonobetainyl-CoA:carnitine CoA-transferase CaiB-like acyl-CoA transferase
MRFSPFNAYEAADGWITLGAATDEDWRSLLAVMDRRDLEDDANMMSVSWRLAHNALVDKVVSAWTCLHSVSEIEAQLARAKVPCGAVKTIDEVLQWEQMRHREMAVPLRNPLDGGEVEASGAGFPIKFGLTRAGYDTAAPVPGAHTVEVLTRLAGVDAAAIGALRASEVI